MFEPDDFALGDTPVEVEHPERVGIRLSIYFAPEEAVEVTEAAAARGLLVTEMAHDLILHALRSVPAGNRRHEKHG